MAAEGGGSAKQKPKPSVDEIWAQLNAATRAPRTAAGPRSGSAATGIPGFGIPGVSTRTRVLPAKPPGAGSQAPPPASTPAAVAAGAAAVAAAAPRYDPAAAGLSGQQVSDYLATLARTINCLADPDRGARKAAAGCLAAKLLRGDAATPKASAAMLQAVLSGPLLQPLGGLLADPVEACRVSALNLLLDAAPQLADPAPLLVGLLPVLVARLGPTPTEEPAEEVRLAAQQLLQAAMAKAAPSTLAAHAADLALLLARGLEDAFPEAKRAAAAGLQQLAGRLPPNALDAQAERLLQALLPNLSHQHSKVRLAALSGLRALVLSGVPAGLLQSQVAPALRPLTFDRAAAVREAHYAALASWLGCGQEAQQQQQQQQQEQQPCSGEPEAAAEPARQAAHARCRTYAPVLLPLLLLGVSDPQESIAAAALQAVEQAGDAWQLQPPAAGGADATAAAAAAPAPAAGATSAEAAQPMDTDDPDAPAGELLQEQQQQSAEPIGSRGRLPAAAGEAEPLAVPAASVAAAALPPPYHGLPSLGARRMVAALLPGLVPDVLSGLREWTASLRSAAVRLLHSCLVFAGPAAAPLLPRLLPALVAALSDDEPDIVERLAASARLLGAFTPSAAWLPLLVDGLADAKAGPAAKANTLVAGSWLVHAAAAAGAPAEPRLLRLLVTALASDELLVCCDHVGLRAQLLTCLGHLLPWMPADVATAARQQLYLVLLQLHGSSGGGGAAAASEAGDAAAPAGVPAAGASSEGAAQAAKALAAMRALAERTGLAGGPAALAEAHGAALLPALTADADAWCASSPHLLAFMSLLRTAGAGCLAALLPKIAQVLQPILTDADRDPSLRLALLQLLDGLLEAPASAPAFSGSAANAALTLHALLMPPLVWRAGKAAAAIRYAAITSLSSFIAPPPGCLAPPPEVLLAAATSEGGLLPLLAGALDEDWFSDVRLAGCFVVRQLLEQVGDRLSDEARRAIYPELLKRLDDSSNQVRVAACGALLAFVRAAGPGYCSTNSGYLAAGVVLHMDDGDGQVAEAACQVLEALAAAKPGVVAAELAKVQERFRARHYIERVAAVCQTQQS